MATRPRTIGIAGPSCSGKTRLARELVRRLGPSARRLPLDAYYRDLAALDPSLREDRNFDHPEALDRDLFVEQLARLASGAAVEVPVYHFETHSRAPAGRQVRPGDWLIVEGLFALCWSDVRGLLQTKVFIDSDDALCLSRRLERDVLSRGRSAESVRAQYERTVRPMFERYVLPTRRFADVLLDGADPLEKSAASLLARLEGFPTQSERQ
jgi:uridine kinase